MRQLIRTIVVTLLLSFTGLVAADEPISIPSDTQSSVNDLNALNYSQDFGQKAINWIAYGTDNPAWGDKSLLSVVSLTLNAIALAMMAWLAVIGGATYVLQTANKGVPGGQVISSFWAPIRVSTATILLIPLTSGYSTLQYGVITVAEKGNAHGSYLMGMGLDYLYDFGAYRAPGLPDGREVIFSLVESEVCRQYINTFTKTTNTIEPIFTTAKRKNDLTLESKVAYRYNETSESPTTHNPRLDYCGAVAFTIEHDEDGWLDGGFIDADEYSAHYGGPPIIAEGQAKLLLEAQKSAAEIAGLILSDEKSLRDLQDYGESQQSTYERAVDELNGNISSAAGKVQSAIATYNSGSQKIIAQTVSKLNDKKNRNDGSSGGWIDQTKEMGWLALGTIFWQINISQSEINKIAATFHAAITPPTPDKEWLESDRFIEMSMRVSGLKKQFGAIEKANAQAQEKYDNNQSLGQPDIIPSLSAIADAGSEGDGWVDNTKSALYAGVAGIVRSALFKNSPDDLIINMQYFGSAMSTTAEALWWTKAITLNMARGMAESIGKSVNDVANKVSSIPVVGWAAKLVGGGAEGTGKGISFALEDISSMINYLIVAMVVVGFTLGVVLPTIPLTQWLMGVVSWMLFFIECLLVSPMWMAAHGTAEKEGWGSEHTRQGYMLMIGLYLNPILRVAGFFAIFVALKPIAWLVSWFFDYVQGVVVSGFAGLFILFGSVIISSIFAYSVMVRIFGLPSELFERGLRWINGGQEVTGDTQSEKEARHTMAAFTSKGESATAHVKVGLNKGPSPKPSAADT